MQETWETWVESLGQEYPLEEEMPTSSSILARKIPQTEEPGGLCLWGRKELDTTEHAHNGFDHMRNPLNVIIYLICVP